MTVKQPHPRWGFVSAKTLWRTVALLTVALTLSAAGADTQNKRWLLVLETSASMQRRTDGTVRAVRALFASEMNGQLQPGDTIGIWTFNQEIFTGRVPLKRWTREAGGMITSDILRFIREQTLENQVNVASILPPLSEIVSNSPLITVILVGSGEGQLRGTPFDEAINEVWTSLKRQQQKARAPILTLLRGVDGRISAHSVSPGQFALDIPLLPEPSPLVAERPIETQPEPKPVKPPVAPRPTAPPLIISGKKPEPKALATDTNPPPEKPAGTNLVNAAPAPAVTNASVSSPVSTNLLESLPTQFVPTPEASAPVVATPPLKNPNLTNLLQPISTQALAATPLLKLPAEQPARQVPGEPRRPGLWIWAVGAGLLLALALLGRMAIRARRRSNHVSLITESLEKDRGGS